MTPFDFQVHYCYLEFKKLSISCYCLLVAKLEAIVGQRGSVPFPFTISRVLFFHYVDIYHICYH